MRMGQGRESSPPGNGRLVVARSEMTHKLFATSHSSECVSRRNNRYPKSEAAGFEKSSTFSNNPKANQQYNQTANPQLRSDVDRYKRDQMRLFKLDRLVYCNNTGRRGISVMSRADHDTKT